MNSRAFEPGATAEVRLWHGLSEVAVERLDFDALIGAWRRAFEAARLALQAARHELPPAELGTRARQLADERVATARLLESFAQERQMKRFLVRLVASSSEAKRLLGLPADPVACVFNVDGILVPSAGIHAEAWKTTFDEFNARRIERTGVPLPSFSVDVDYPRPSTGEAPSRASTRTSPAAGSSCRTAAGTTSRAAKRSTGSPTARTALSSRCSLGAAHILSRAPFISNSCRRGDAVRRRVRFPHMHLLLERARLTRLIDAYVDGNTARSEHLRRKPAPDMLLAACRQLGVSPDRTAVFETTLDGVEAGRAGKFETVVAVDQHTRRARWRHTAPTRRHGPGQAPRAAAGRLSRVDMNQPSSPAHLASGWRRHRSRHRSPTRYKLRT